MTSRFNYFINHSRSQEFHSVLSYWDKNLDCKFANQETVNWFGIKPSQLAGRNKLELLLGEDYSLHVPYVQEVFNGKSQAFEYDRTFIEIGRKPVIATYFPDIELGVVVGFFLHFSLKKEKAENENLLKPNNKSCYLSLSSNNKIPQVVLYLKSQLFIGFPKLEYLANIHLISVSKLMRDFKKEHGTSPFLFYRSLQMEFASRHIKDSGYSKKQLAMILGFSNPANFTSCYNRWLKEQIPSDLVSELNIKTPEDNLRFIIAQLPISVAVLDQHLNFTLFSEKWVSDFSIDPTILTNKSVFEFFPKQRMKWLRILVDCLGGLTRKALLDQVEFSNGACYLLNWEIKPWIDDQKNVIGLIICTTIH
ncbi:AraC-like DNA-binding protein [Pedobacter sp. CAN_A7]|uniref:helix-turn-helix domain-containing protein n=1 Tax=Pedobacter sp. CAN_A7 TaxID=2787722 RepID=UPI0018CAAB3C